MEELSPNDRKFILTQLKKMYSGKRDFNLRVNGKSGVWAHEKKPG